MDLLCHSLKHLSIQGRTKVTDWLDEYQKKMEYRKKALAHLPEQVGHTIQPGSDQGNSLIVNYNIVKLRQI